VYGLVTFLEPVCKLHISVCLSVCLFVTLFKIAVSFQLVELQGTKMVEEIHSKSDGFYVIYK
jgi:hypothetical protein